MINKVLLSVLMLLVMGNSAVAQRLTYSADFTGVSNYIFRGQSLTNDSPGVLAAFYIRNESGWAYRFQGSTYDVNGDTDGRAEFSLNYRGEMDKYFDVMFGVTAYGYESEDRESTEWHVGLEAFDVSVVYHRNEEQDTQYYDFNYFYRLTDAIKLDVHYGIASPLYQDETSDDYSVTASYQWRDDLSFFVTAGSHNRLEDFSLVGITYWLK